MSVPPAADRPHVRLGVVLALCLVVLAVPLAQNEAIALGVDAPRPPAPAATPDAKPGEAVSGTAGTDQAGDKPAAAARPKPKAAASATRRAGGGSAVERCPATTRTEAFEPGRIYRLQSRRGFVSEIRLGLGDSISEWPVGGDTDGWDVDSPPGATVVTVKPRKAAVNTNLILRAAGRSYLIALEVIPEYSPCNGEWQLSFQVPAPPPPVVLMVESPEVVAARKAKNLQEAAQAIPAGRNWSYSMQVLPGADDIVPTEVFDDGRFTYIRIPGNRELPSVFRISTDGTESFVERHMDGRDLMVIHEVARQWVLRLDRQTVGLWNDAFDIEGVPPVAGARSDRVRRVVRGGEAP